MLAAGDRPRVRLALAIALAALLWAVFLAEAPRLFAPDKTSARPPETIEMRLVEVPLPVANAPGPVHPQTVSPPAAQVASPPRRDTRTPPHAAAQAVARHEPSKATAKPDMAQRESALPSPNEPVVTAAHAAPPAAASAAASTANRDAPAAASASGSLQARLLSQPLPVLPDDLREDAYRAVAVARFDVHADGSTDVELVKPTPNPRLNQILLEALHKWRFFPAMENGRPVESRQDVRVHFNVS
jgi:periplasmic protein TonB